MTITVLSNRELNRSGQAGLCPAQHGEYRRVTDGHRSIADLLAMRVHSGLDPDVDLELPSRNQWARPVDLS